MAEYGIPRDVFDSVVESIDFKCEICSEYMDKICVDHDHKSGLIRGLLCHECNAILGFFDDNIEVLMSAIDYLIRAKNSLAWDKMLVANGMEKEHYYISQSKKDWLDRYGYKKTVEKENNVRHTRIT